MRKLVVKGKVLVYFLLNMKRTFNRIIMFQLKILHND